jgi:tRNA(fMet)-specific endonuclease VapC
MRQARLEVLLRGLPVLPFDASAAVAYGRIIAQCGWARRRDYDRMIAAHSGAVYGKLAGLGFAKPIEK